MDSSPCSELPLQSEERMVERNGRALDAKLGFDLGWDMASYGLRPPVLPNDALLSGYEEAASRRCGKPLAHDRFIRKWLQLRVGAWLRHRVVSEDVTPAYLRSIDRDVCPVTCLKLTHATGTPSDWSVDRINNDGAYAPGNLAVLSSLANKAKGRKSFSEVLEAAAHTSLVDGLETVQWKRLAALMSVPCHLGTGTLPLMPYPLKPLVGVPLSFEQSLQWTLVNQCYGGPKAVVGKLKDACSSLAKQKTFHQLVQKVRRKSERLVHWPDVWLNDSLWVVFERFVRTMTDAEVDRFHDLISPKHSISGSDLVGGWLLDYRGYVPGYAPPECLPSVPSTELPEQRQADLVVADRCSEMSTCEEDNELSTCDMG